MSNLSSYFAQANERQARLTASVRSPVRRNLGVENATPEGTFRRRVLLLLLTALRLRRWNANALLLRRTRVVGGVLLRRPLARFRITVLRALAHGRLPM